jgi:hypothetical protein
MPEPLRPLLQRMLASDPKQRMRSMEEVVRWLDDWSKGKAPAGPADKGAGKGAALGEKLAALKIPPALKEPRGAMIAGGGALGLLALLALGLSFTGGSGDETAAGGPVPAEQVAAPGAVPARPADPVAAARIALSAGASRLPCSWIEVASVEGGQGAPVAVTLKGVSGQTAQAIGQVETTLKQAGLPGVSVNYADIGAVSGSFCNVIDTLSQVRGTGMTHLSVPQSKFEIAPLGGDWQGLAGQARAQALIEIDTNGLAGGRALVFLHEDGTMQFAPDLDALKPPMKIEIGGGKYRLNLPIPEAGWAAMFLVVGPGPYDKALFEHEGWNSYTGWDKKFLAAAQAKGWKTEMVWFKVVNEQPDAAR